MKKPLLAAMIAVLLVGACGGTGSSRLNPFKWFSRTTEEPGTLEPKGGYAAALADNRALVDQVLTLMVERMPGGAIVRATGLPPTQGWWDAELVAENDGKPVDGVMSYRFVIAAPRDATRSSTQQSREVTVATYLSDVKLAAISRITVTGARNSLSTRR
jgi:hypothetical protein